MRRTLFAAVAALSVAAAGTAWAEDQSQGGEGHAAAEIRHQNWSFDGLFGTFNQAQLRRGFEVYNTVCAACHSLSLVAYRNLADVGLSEEEIRTLAASKEMPGEPDEDGSPTTRPALPSDRIVPPFPNDNAARAANNGALPPDLTLMVKARLGGADYLYSLLTGYTEPPAGVEVQEGLYYNSAFAGHQIAMPPPLSEGQVQYADGTEASVEQMSRDVTAFLAWTAEPELEARKRLGVKVVLFLILLTAMLYAIKRKVWADVH